MQPYTDNLQKLKMGTILRGIQKENKEPEHAALDQVSKELRYLQRQYEYVAEVERVLKELRLTVFFIKGCRSCEVPDGVRRQELLAYYQGNFLNLVHQIKDKISQLVNLMTETTIPEKPSVEKDISVDDLLQKKSKQLQVIGIEEEIKQWKQENVSSKIAVALRKRVQHHHRVSGLRYDKDFLNLGFTDIANRPDVQQQLTDYGKEHIKKMQQDSTERLYSGAISKVESTLKVIEENVENISEKLVIHFKLPISQEETSKILKEQSEIMHSFDIVNTNSIDKVIEPYKSILDALISKVQEEYKDQIAAIYLIGSLGRGEYEEGYSDISIYIILNIQNSPGQGLKEGTTFSVRVFTQTEFFSEESQKYRIIAKLDGLLLCGTDVIKDEKIPKAGLLLAMILNDDILEILDAAKKWMEDNPQASTMEINKKSKRLAKRIIDFMYGVVMSNKPQYTASRRERVEKLNEAYPEAKRVHETMFALSKYGVKDFQNFKNMIDGFRPKAEENLKKMHDIKEYIDKSQKNRA